MPLNGHLHALIVHSSDNFSAQTASPKAPAKPGYDKFRKDTQIAHFLRFCKGGTKGNLAKK